MRSHSDLKKQVGREVPGDDGKRYTLRISEFDVDPNESFARAAVQVVPRGCVFIEMVRTKTRATVLYAEPMKTTKKKPTRRSTK